MTNKALLFAPLVEAPNSTKTKRAAKASVLHADVFFLIELLILDLSGEHLQLKRETPGLEQVHQ
jgi:hypothetical protein